MAQSSRGSNPLTILEDNTSKIIDTLNGLSHIQVFVGIASDSASQEEKHGTGQRAVGTDKREDDGSKNPITNSALAYIHENGSPLNNIPPRPFLHPGIRDSRDRWIKHLQEAGTASMEGRQADMYRSLNRAGMIALLAVKNKITAGIPPPLAPRTVAARKAKHPSRKAKTAEQMTPLVDTAQMLNALTYVIRTRK